MFKQDALMKQLGSTDTNQLEVPLRSFALFPYSVVEGLAKEALQESWGENYHILRQYISMHVAWSISQGTFAHSDTRLYLCAGNVVTRYGTPIYLVIEENQFKNEPQPWAITAYTSQLHGIPELPYPATVPQGEEIPLSAEIVMSHDHILEANEDRVEFLKGIGKVAQMCAISGAIQWAIRRGLACKYLYFGQVRHMVPLYLQSREDITTAPDLVAPIEIHRDYLIVRTVLEPWMPYGKARVLVPRHDHLPAWLLSAWHQRQELVRQGKAATSEDTDSPETKMSVPAVTSAANTT